MADDSEEERGIGWGAISRPAPRFAPTNIVSAMRSLGQNALRTFLSMSGVGIGVLAVVTLTALLQGVKSEITRQVEGLGANLIMIVPGRLGDDGQPNPMAMLGVSSLSDADVAKLRQVPGVQEIAPVMFLAGAVETPAGASATALAVGTNAQGVRMNPAPLAEGRYFDESETGAKLCVLTEKPRRALFGSGACLGRNVRIHGTDWLIVGTLGRLGDDRSMSNGMLYLGNLVYVPEAAARRFIPGGQVNRIVLRTDYRHPADRLVVQLDNAMRAVHGGREDYGIITQKMGLAMVIKLLDMARYLLVLIGALSLFIAGMGIMNVMLVTVTERTREIGVRLTVGARRIDIFQQFVAEALAISVAGGAIGSLASWLLCAAIARFSPLTPDVNSHIVALALGVCTLIGLLFGVIPAIRAASLDPIDALRRES